MESALDLLRALDDPGHLAALAPELVLTAGGLPRPEPQGPNDGDEQRWLEAEGVATLAGLEPPDACAALVSAIRKLVGAGLPATFVYAFDAVWLAGERIRACASAMTGARYELVADAWAWEIPPGRRGWPPHRGLSAPTFDRARPEVLNTWLALSDATAERSCMHFVPLDDDPGYPDAMDRLDAPLERVRALPVQAGTALAWNANVLHWGGPCALRAPGPRVSCSFTLCRTEQLAAVTLEQLDYRARMELIASQIVTYGSGQPDVSAQVFEWAHILHRMAAGVRKEG